MYLNNIGCVRINEPLSILVTSLLYFIGLDYCFFPKCTSESTLSKCINGKVLKEFIAI